MLTINQNIISEIKNLPETTEEIKDFLVWILGYERDHAERQSSNFKVNIGKKLDEIFLTKT